jgi:hypothetical protein
MRRYKATIDVYLEVDEKWGPDYEGALADGMSAIMQDVQEQTAADPDEGFAVVDWSYNPYPTYEANYALPFEGLTPEEQLQADRQG